MDPPLYLARTHLHIFIRLNEQPVINDTTITDTAVLHAERHAVFSGLESIVVAQTTPIDKLRAMLSLRVVVPLRIVPFARS
jgi:hypothetical protein